MYQTRYCQRMGTYKAIIVGTGFAGLLMGYRLKQAGIDDFIILEKAESVGGTWRENTYPGAECDVPSALYSYSFAPNPTWKFKWAKQPQILEYIQDFVTEQGLLEHIRFGVEVRGAVWDESKTCWHIQSTAGDTWDAQFFIPAIGQLHIPNTPDFAGRESFDGASFHTAQWDHSVDYSGKDMAIIGNAASAIQVIPEVAKDVAKLTIYQRSPNWIIPKKDRPYSRFEHWLLRKFPRFASAYRFNLWCQGEYMIWPTIKGNRFTRGLLKTWSKLGMRKHIKDAELRQRLTPDYPMGAKRILLSDKIFPALARENVELVFDTIQTFTPEGIQAGETRRSHDLVVFATGFETNPFLKMIDVRGQGKQSLRQHWKDGAYAYLGVATAGFPNMLMMYGPNTNTGHTSIIYKLEGQANYILQVIQEAGEDAIVVDTQAEVTYNEEVQRRLGELAFSKIEKSWYKDGERVTNNWMGSSREFRKRLRTPHLGHYHRLS